MISGKSILLAGLAATVIGTPLVALGSHGKAGLWEVTTHMNMPGMSAQIPPEALARMRAMGVHMPDSQTITARHCMTAADVASDRPPPMHNPKDCAMTNMSHDAHSFTADMTCSGEMEGRGHFSVAYDSDEHYSGSYTFNGTAHGHPQNMTTSFEGRWVSPDCGSEK